MDRPPSASPAPSPPSRCCRCSLPAATRRPPPPQRPERPVQVQRVAFEADGCEPRIRRRGAGAARDRSRLPGRRQDDRAPRQCRRHRAGRRRGGASSIRRTSICRSRARRPSSPPPPRTSPTPPPTKPATPTSRPAARVAVADYDHKKAARDEAVGRLERARRALDLAGNQRAYAQLRADVDGVITATLAEPGQVVALGQPVARLAHHGEMEALVALPETWLGEARKADATIVLWSDPGQQLRGPSARALAPGRRHHPHLCGALHHRAARRSGRARHDRDREAFARLRGRSPGCRSPPFSTAAPARPSIWSTAPARSSCAR